MGGKFSGAFILLAALLLSGCSITISTGGNEVKESSKYTYENEAVDSNDTNEEALLPSMKYKDNTELKRIAEEALFDRYGIYAEATALETYGDGPFSEPTIRVILDYNGTNINVELEKDGSNIKDNYPLVWMNEEANILVEDMALQVWDVAAATSNLYAAVFQEVWTEDAGIYEVFENEGVIAEWNITVSENMKDGLNNAKKFIDVLYKSKLYGRVRIDYLDGSVFIHGTKNTKPSNDEIEEAFKNPIN